MYTCGVKCLEKNFQGNSSSGVVDWDREAVFRMSEKHPDEGNMDRDEEDM